MDHKGSEVPELSTKADGEVAECAPQRDRSVAFQVVAGEVLTGAGREPSHFAWITNTCSTASCLNPDHMRVHAPLALAYPKNLCIYCGRSGYTVDHLLPRGWSGDTGRKYVAVVPACGTCNSLLSDSLTWSITERRALCHKRLRRKFATVLNTVDQTPEELEEYGLSMRSYLSDQLDKKRAVLDMLAWPVDPTYDLRALEQSGIDDPFAAGLLIDPGDLDNDLQQEVSAGVAATVTSTGPDSQAQTPRTSRPQVVSPVDLRRAQKSILRALSKGPLSEAELRTFLQETPVTVPAYLQARDLLVMRGTVVLRDGAEGSLGQFSLSSVDRTRTAQRRSASPKHTPQSNRAPLEPSKRDDDDGEQRNAPTTASPPTRVKPQSPLSPARSSAGPGHRPHAARHLVRLDIQVALRNGPLPEAELRSAVTRYADSRTYVEERDAMVASGAIVARTRNGTSDLVYATPKTMPAKTASTQRLGTGTDAPGTITEGNLSAHNWGASWVVTTKDGRTELARIMPTHGRWKVEVPADTVVPPRGPFATVRAALVALANLLDTNGASGTAEA